MRFTLKQLLYVDAVARTGSIAQAAQEQNISQSSITAAIDMLEDELGYDLFVRMPAKGVTTTQAGLEALGYIGSFLGQARHLGGDLRSIDGDPQGMMHIACYVTAAPYVLPVMLKGFARSFPGVGITIYEGDMIEVSRMLMEGKADVACGYWGVPPEQRAALPRDISVLPLFEARPYAVVGSDDSLAGKRKVTLAELAQRPMIMLDLPRTVDYFTGLFRSKGLDLRIAHSARSSEMVQALVASGFGFSILNTRLPERVDQEPGLVARPIIDDVASAEFGVAVLPRVRHPRIVSAFLDHSRELREAGAFRRFVMEQA